MNSVLVGKGDINDIECAKVFSINKKIGRVIEKRTFFNKSINLLVKR